MFQPPFCPHRRCSQHLDPQPRFFHRHGTYHPRCRPHPVPRFRCRSCRRTFSRQTFRADYYDKRPDLNEKLFDKLTSGSGLRDAGRKLALSKRCTELKYRKIARHLRRLNLNLRRPLEGVVQLQFDELETFETNRSLRPVTFPVLLERTTRYLIWGEAAPIRPKGKMTKARRARIAREIRRHGRRGNGSVRACRRTLQRGVDVVAPTASVILQTDEKRTYPILARRAFGPERLEHQTTNSKVARATWNQLFPVNHEDTRMRCTMGRLRRESWLVTKRRRYLDLAFHMNAAYRNLVRTRYNDDKESPAQMLGFVHRRLTHWEVLGWAQVWGKRSIHPASPRRRSVAAYEASAKSAA